MPRYTKTRLDANRGAHPNNGFIGWDSLDEESSEASKREDLFLEMNVRDRSIFSSLNSGQAIHRDDHEYLREY
jgi:hypothetical protein